MYCSKCGVQLSEGQKICPICDTRVYHPDIEEAQVDTYPKIPFKSEEFNRKGLMFIITMVFLIPLLLPIFLELGWHSSINWSGYVAGGTLLFYVTFLLPSWFKHPNPVIFVPCVFAVTIVFLLYVCLTVKGDWFMPFVFPAVGSLGVISTAEAALLYYVKRGRLYTVGGGFIALGCWTVLLELLIRNTFKVNFLFYWSTAPLTVLVIVGLMLIVIGIVKPLKESLRRIFFIGKV